MGRRGGRATRLPLASSFPGCHYARVRYSGILIPMPLHFAITITRYSPGLRVAPDLCRLAIYISSKCFSIPAAEGLWATQMDMWTFTFYATTPVVLTPPPPAPPPPSHLRTPAKLHCLTHGRLPVVSNRGLPHRQSEEYVSAFITAMWLTLWQRRSSVLYLI